MQFFSRAARVTNTNITLDPAPRRKVWKIAWPTIAEQFLQLTVGFNEVFLLGHLTGEASSKLGYDSEIALSASSLGQFFVWMTFAAFNGVGIATTALVARSVGAKDPAKASIYARHGLMMALAVGLLMMGVVYFLAPVFLVGLGASGKLLELGTIFSRVLTLSMPMQALLIVGNACLRGTGDTRTPLVIMIVANIINIITAWVLINGAFGFPMLGVVGAAIGAVASFSFGGIAVTLRLLGKVPFLNMLDKFRIKWSFQIDWSIIRTIFGQGWPTVAEQWAFQFGIFFFARFLLSQGPVVYAAHVTVINIDSISFLPSIGMGIATTVLVGQSLGAGKPEQAEAYAYSAMQIALLFMGIMGLLFFFFPQVFVGILISDPKIIAEAARGLQIAAVFELFIGVNFVLMGALRGAGDSRFPFYARFVTSVIIRVGAAFIFIQVLNLGLVGGRLAMALDAVCMTVLVVWRFRSGVWKRIFRERQARSAQSESAKAHLPASEPVEPEPEKLRV